MGAKSEMAAAGELQSGAESRQAAKSRATKEKIITAVIGLIKEQGFSAASSSQIAKRAGVTWGAVQHHFGGKNEILEQVLERSHQAFHQRLSDPRFIEGDAEARVSNYVEAAWGHYQGDEYMATVEILLASRGRSGSSAASVNELAIGRSREAHLKLARSIFYDSRANDKTLGEAIYVVHCMLTGILIETALEPKGFDTAIYIEHLKLSVSRLLYASD